MAVVVLRLMSFEESDFAAFGRLLEQKLDEKLQPLMERLRSVQDQIEGVYAANETREHEYLAISEQLKRLETSIDGSTARLDRIEEQLDRIVATLSSVTKRVDGLERKCA